MNGNGSMNSDGDMNGRGSADNQILIDTNSIPLASNHEQMAPIHHHLHLNQHHQQPIQPQTMSNPIMQQQHSNDGDFGDHQHHQEQTTPTITSQPGAASRVAPESQNVVYSVHPMFNCLDEHDLLLVRQKADPTKTCCGFESVNTYTVRGKDGQPVLRALEYSNCCERCCFEGNREYNLSLVFGEETVARIRKPYRLSRFCCYSNAVRIESPEDNPIGFISQQFTLFGHVRYAIFDCQQSSKTPTFLLKSSSCQFCFTPFLCTCLCPNKEFKIVSVEHGEEVGRISRHWQHDLPIQEQDNDHDPNAIGLGADSTEMKQTGPSDQSEHELIANENSINSNPDPDLDDDGCRQRQDGDPSSNKSKTKSKQKSSSNQLFGIQFEPNLEARHKVLLLSACFMMDFFYFEKDRRRRKLASC